LKTERFRAIKNIPFYRLAHPQRAWKQAAEKECCMSDPAAPAREIAPRLRELRESVGMSPEQMAVHVGAAAEEVLQFESGEIEIPASYLFKAAHACGVDMTVLLSGDEPHLQRYTLTRNGRGLTVDRRKDYGYSSLAPNFINRRMEPFLVVVPPKEAKDMVQHTHEGHEFMYILEGRLEISLGKTALTLEPGDSLYFDSMTPHALRGLDDRQVRLLDVIT
jgi:mannose-6-phosphate isomerase-like protein (cupin superfamily)/DNA-binding XRE family transcriptional regulator